MFNTPTTIVVGAGASAELGLPVGDGLMVQISELLKPDDRKTLGFSNDMLSGAIRQKIGHQSDGGFQAAQRWRTAAQKIRIGLQFHQSIDNLLHFLADDEDAKALGKLAIAMCITDDEQRSHFFKDAPTHATTRATEPRLTEGVRASWYAPLGRKLLSETQRTDLRRLFQNVTFIIFNYDRCLEQYLSMMVQSAGALSTGERLADIIPSNRFIHPYGSIGLLPWQVENGAESLSFGQGNEADFWKVSENIKTFTESVESHVAARIKHAVQSANVVLLLGFGFNPQNVDLLTPTPEKLADRVIATAYGKGGDELAAIRSLMSRFAGRYNPTLIMDNGSCRDMFDRLQVTLSLI